MVCHSPWSSTIACINHKVYAHDHVTLYVGTSCAAVPLGSRAMNVLHQSVRLPSVSYTTHVSTSDANAANRAFVLVGPYRRATVLILW